MTCTQTNNKTTVNKQTETKPLMEISRAIVLVEPHTFFQPAPFRPSSRRRQGMLHAMEEIYGGEETLAAAGLTAEQEDHPLHIPPHHPDLQQLFKLVTRGAVEQVRKFLLVPYPNDVLENDDILSVRPLRIPSISISSISPTALSTLELL